MVRRSEIGPTTTDGSRSDPDRRAAPVFVVGAMRSGTTLLRLMLNRHSALAIPSESHFLAALFHRFDPGAVLGTEAIEDALQILATNVEWNRDWSSDLPSLRQRVLRAQPISLGSFIDEVFVHETEPTGKPRWGAKTPAHLFQVNRLRACLPSTQFINMVRDPRDAFLSLAPHDWVGTSSWQVGSYLLRCGRLAQRYGTDGVGDFITVRYEDLVLEPETTLQRVCTFIGLPYERTMLEFHVDAKDNVRQWELDLGTHGKLLRPPDAKDVERWKREGSMRDLREVEAVTFDALGWFGYERTVSRSEAPWLRRRAQLRHHFRHPASSARALGSRATQLLRRSSNSAR